MGLTGITQLLFGACPNALRGATAFAMRQMSPRLSLGGLGLRYMLQTNIALDEHNLGLQSKSSLSIRCQDTTADDCIYHLIAFYTDEVARELGFCKLVFLHKAAVLSTRLEIAALGGRARR